ncbi:hypothetical protein Neosp_008977 [[Neocosmospora] mangrovei]
MERNRIKYSDCHPKGKPGVRFPLAGVHVDPHDIGARRAHMVAFLRHMELHDEKSWAEARASSIAALCLRLHKQGLEKVSAPYFEFFVDLGIWIYFFKRESPSPAWPWQVPAPKQDDLAQGASAIFADWLKNEAEKGASKKSEAPNDPATTVAQPTEHAVAAHTASTSIASTSTLPSASETETATEAPAHILLPPQRLSSLQRTDEMEIDDPSGLPPDRHAFRLDIWRALNRSDHWIIPICGPFEVLLPKGLDFDDLVWGPEGAHFTYMHKELIDEDLMITWSVNDGVASKLIMGFRDDAEGSQIPLCKMDRLGLLFSRVTNWAADVYNGSAQSLLSHLSLGRIMSNESMYQTLKPDGRLCLAWEESQR